jgi:hypothetical protein
MQQHGYTVLRRERRSVRRGPFFWTTSKNQFVYFVVVEDASGQQRRGWARCGGWWLGMISSQVDVIWE